jgi:hypothetical protein
MEQDIQTILDDVEFKYMTYQIDRAQALEEVRTRIAKAFADRVAAELEPVIAQLREGMSKGFSAEFLKDMEGRS